MTAFRPSELWSIREQDVKLLKDGTESVIRIVGHFADLSDSSKNINGGLKAINSKPPDIFIWNRWQVKGKFNAFIDIKEYIDLTKLIRSDRERFFLVVNHNQTAKARFFKCSNLGTNTFRTYIQNAYSAAEVTASGVCDHKVLHRLRGTVITRLFEAVNVHSSVALRSGHRYHRSFAGYQNLQRSLGRTKRFGILRSEGSPVAKKRKTDVQGEGKKNDDLGDLLAGSTPYVRVLHDITSLWQC